MIACYLIVYHYIFDFDIYKNELDNGTNQKRNKIDKEFLQTNATQKLIYVVGLPFILMLIFSNLLIHTIFKSRLRIFDRCQMNTIETDS